MIFVTVGTHEQPFNRLVEKMDNLVREGVIKDDVVIQTGYSTYVPQYCAYQKFFAFNDMFKLVKDADIVITHGGPSSFIMPLQEGRIPVVVPRKAEFNEHVNDHQVKFCHAVEERKHNIIVVDDVDELGDVLRRYKEDAESMTAHIKFHNKEFCRQFTEIVNAMVG